MYIKEPFIALNATESFGIDKLHLFTNTFQVDSIKGWNVRPNNKKAGEDHIEQTPLFTCKGETVYGAAAFMNFPDYTAEIKYGKLHLQFNPSKLFHAFHLTTDQDKIADALERIQGHIKTHLQTDVDLFSTSVSRMDLTAQAAMHKTVPHYDQVIKGSRQLRRAPKTEYPHGFLMGNKTRQLCTYDKGLKLQIDEHTRAELLAPSNLLRVETRLLNARAMKQQSAFQHTADILTATPTQLKTAYSKTFNALLRIDQAPIEFIELSALTDLIATAHKLTNRNQWLMFVITVLSAGGNLPTVTQFEQALIPLIHSKAIERTTAWRNVRKYQEIIQQTRFIQSKYIQDSETNFADLHKEFTDTFINQYKTA